MGGVVGAVVAITKLVPERAKIIVGYQSEVIDDLRGEMERKDKAHKDEIDVLRLRVSALEGEIEQLKGSATP